MPELPEVEVTRQGIAPLLENAEILGSQFSSKSLRWPAPANLAEQITGKTVQNIARRGKYLLMETAPGWVIVHLGMSGHLQFVADGTPLGAWDHFDLRFRDSRGRVAVLRLTDPRRFGAVLWQSRSAGAIETHPLLSKLGREPFDPSLNAEHLRQGFQNRSVAIKQALLAGDVIVGVGNIYASEALFRAGIRPQTPAQRLSRARCERLLNAIRETLSLAIQKGGSTLRDFCGTDGQPGYFQQEYFVYSRAGQPCHVCGSTVKLLKQGQRSSFYCSNCQH